MTSTHNLALKAENSTLDFLNRCLNSSDSKLIPLAGDASSRRYFRVIHQDKSYVLMDWEPFDHVKNYPFLSVQQHFKKNGVHVPEIMGASPEAGLLLLEDLGDLTLERKFWEKQNQDNILPFYKMAIDEILKIHYTATEDRDDSSTCFQLSFDQEKFMWEMNYAKKHLLLDMCKLDFSQATLKELEKDFIKICSRLDVQPKRLSHRDYHSRNLMLKLDKMKVIDFQDARLGPVQYDLVSLLCDSYVNLDESIKNKILAYYLDKSQSEHNVFYNFDEFIEIYNLQLIQRCFKACGSFASFYNTRGDQRYLQYLHPTLVHIVNNLEEQNNFSTFLNVIQDSGLMEIDFEALE